MELRSEAVRSGTPEQIIVPAACLAAFVLKVSFELATGDTIFVKSLGSGTVGVPLAHVVGAAVGCLVGLGTRPKIPAIVLYSTRASKTRDVGADLRVRPGADTQVGPYGRVLKRYSASECR